MQATDTLSVRWNETRKQQLRMGVIALFVVWALYTLSQIIWLLLIPTENEPAPLPVFTGGPSQTKSAKVDIAKITGFNLFGDAGAVEQALVAQPVISDEDLNAAKTSLNLKLFGVAYAADQMQASAVISHNNRQAQYRVNDKLPGGNSVKLSKVLTDRVIISNNGKAESLWLYEEGENFAPPVRRATRPKQLKTAGKVDLRNDEEVSRAASRYRQKLISQPQSLAEVIRILPANKDGALIGYRLSPGRDPAKFAELGLKPNDIVTSVNGIDLSQAQNVVQVYQTLRSATEASVSLLRGETPLELIISLNAESEVAEAGL